MYVQIAAGRVDLRGGPPCQPLQGLLLATRADHVGAKVDITGHPGAIVAYRRAEGAQRRDPGDVGKGKRIDSAQSIQRRRACHRGKDRGGKVGERKSTRLNSSHQCASRMPSSACNKTKNTTKKPNSLTNTKNN